MKKIFKILIASLIGAILALLLVSCGSRKIQKSASKEETKTELTDNSTIEKKSETNVKTTTTLNVDDKNETVTEETIYEPKDPAKESFVIEKDGTKTVFGNARKTVKKTIQKNNTATSKEILQVQNENKAFKEQKDVTHKEVLKKENSSKQVDKKQFNPLNLIWIGSLALFVLWCAYRIYKKLPLVPKF